MQIKHHPDVSTLITCSAGSTSEALSAVVASHLSLCPECMHELGKLEQIGVALFDALEPTKLTGPVDHNCLPAVPTTEAETEKVELTDCDVPAPLVCLLGKHLDDIPWRQVGPGLWLFDVTLSPAAKGHLQLLRLEPGHSIAEHDHQGEELSVVLRGSYSDAFGTYKRGDLADLDEGKRHSPTADPHEGCIVLMASEHPPILVAT